MATSQNRIKEKIGRYVFTLNDFCLIINFLEVCVHFLSLVLLLCFHLVHEY